MNFLKNLFSTSNYIDSILSNFELKEHNDPPPSLDEILNAAEWIASNSQCNNPVFIDTVLAYRSLQQMGQTIDDPVVVVQVYAIGVLLFESGDVKTSMMFFEWAIQIHKGFHQAYNRLGDCWMRFRDRSDKSKGFWEEAICYYKTSLHYCDEELGSNDPTAMPFAIADYKGDNYLKIGLCLLEMGRKEDAKKFVIRARNMVDKEYRGHLELGFRNWDSVLDKIDNYDYQFEQREAQKRKKTESYLQDKVNKAVQHKRNGEFEKAHQIYLNLDNKFPNTPLVFKSWAKVLVCMGSYEDAISNFSLASDLYKKQGNEGESWQCDNHISKIRNRRIDLDNFINYMRALSGNPDFKPKL